MCMCVCVSFSFFFFNYTGNIYRYIVKLPLGRMTSNEKMIRRICHPANVRHATLENVT